MAFAGNLRAGGGGEKASAGDEGDGGAYPAPALAWSAIALLFAATLSSQLDRQLPALLVQPLKAEFHLSNTGFGFLQGYAFALVYTFAGLPLGWLVDRTGRRNLLLGGLAFWSLMTILAGFARTSGELVLSRMGVGLGEAVLAPAAYSMIADLIPPDRRGRALSAYYVSLAIGSGASLVLGGLILQLVPKGGLSLPGALILAPWRAAFLLAGLPGCVLALALVFIPEPRRRRDGAPGGGASLRALAAHLRGARAAYAVILLYPALVALIGYALLAWAPAFYQARFALPAKRAGIPIGVAVAAGGLAGTLLSGWLSDRWRARNLPAARLTVAALAFAVMLPALSAFLLAPTLPASLVALGLTVAGFSMAQAAAPAVIQEITPNRFRGRVVALYLCLGGLVGIGLGPLLVGFALDHAAKGAAALPAALALVGLPGALLGLSLTVAGRGPYQRALEFGARTESAAPASAPTPNPAPSAV